MVSSPCHRGAPRVPRGATTVGGLGAMSRAGLRTPGGPHEVTGNTGCPSGPRRRSRRAARGRRGRTSPSGSRSAGSRTSAGPAAGQARPQPEIRVTTLTGLVTFTGPLVFEPGRALRGAVLSKCTVVTLPAVLLILDAYPLRRRGGSAGWRSSGARRVCAEEASVPGPLHPRDRAPDSPPPITLAPHPPLANPRSNAALAHLCDTLNALEVMDPGTTLKMVYEAPRVA